MRWKATGHLIPYLTIEIQKYSAPIIKGNHYSVKGFLYVSDKIKGLLDLSENMEGEGLFFGGL